MPILRVRRFLQDPGHCAVASAAVVANYHNKEITYEQVKKIADNDGDGLYTVEIALLLNKIGFQKVTIVSSDVSQLDYKWKNLSRAAFISALKKSLRKNKEKYYKEVNSLYCKFLSDKTKENNVIIDYHFGDYIRNALDKGSPVLVSFNWNVHFQWTKWNKNGNSDPINGETEDHEVVICGYDDYGVSVVDSHHDMYKGKLKKFKSGRYRMSWETLMTVMGFGDLVIPEGFCKQDMEAK
jgi:hypothetical protein